MTAPAPAPARKRGGGSLPDLARTLLVVGVVVAIIFFVSRFHTGSDPLHRVDSDVAATVAQARPVSPFPLLVPGGLPSSWAPTSVSYRPSAELGGAPVFHLGYVTPSGGFADLEEAAVDVGPVLAPYLKGGSPMLRTVGATHTGVAGNATADELRTLLDSLRP